MFRDQGLISTIISAITVLFGAILMVAGSICMSDTHFLRHGWQQIYALSICNIVAGALAFLFAVGLIYVVARKLPALTIVMSISILVLSVYTLICLIILSVGITDLRRHTYNETQHLIQDYSGPGEVIATQQIVGKIQNTFGCCNAEQISSRKLELSEQTVTGDSCCLTVTSKFRETSALTIPEIHLKGFLEPIYSYTRKRYIILITLDTIVVILLVASAISGFIFEHNIRQQYVPM